jgi:dihydrofolate synthase
MIELGLSRISRLVNPSSLSWKAIHVAGTNGKGSVCAYLSAMLNVAGIQCGRFTSPHLIDRWDCITIHGKVIPESLFHAVEERIKDQDHQSGIGASEFELLTATAFEIFNREKVDVGVVEVGMGGRLDATNVLEDKLVTVITKIGHDHEAYLGHTLEEISLHKAGIMRPGVDCVIDGTNAPDVLKTLKDHASQVGAEVFIALPDQIGVGMNKRDRSLLDTLEHHQLSNLACAKTALDLSMKSLRPGTNKATLINAALTAHWPGRLEHLTLDGVIPRSELVLVDGAHNAQSAEVLRTHVSQQVRIKGQPVTWVLAASKGKKLQELFGTMVEDRDKVVVVKFGTVDGMPWVEPTDASEIIEALNEKKELEIHDCTMNLLDGLALAARIANGKPLVIAGSLYLVSDVHRLLRSQNAT